jgi:hypothetical protein
VIFQSGDVVPPEPLPWIVMLFAETVIAFDVPE